MTEYDESTCLTAGQLRDMGTAVPESIPDCGWVPRCSIRFGEPKSYMTAPDYEDGVVRCTIPCEFTVPFSWISLTFAVDDSEKDQTP